MNSVRYVGMDVHRDTISVAVLDESGRLMMQSVLATRAGAILDFIHGVRGALHVTFEEGTHSAWLYDVLVRRVEKLVVCDPRKNALLKSGSKSDAIDARKLAELLRAGMLSPVYHGETSALEVQQMARSYTQLTEDTTRVMARLKAVFRGQAVSCVGKKLYGKRHRDEYLAQLSGGLRRRAEHLYRELDALQPLRHEVRRELMAECRRVAQALDLVVSSDIEGAPSLAGGPAFGSLRFVFETGVPRSCVFCKGGYDAADIVRFVQHGFEFIAQRPSDICPWYPPLQRTWGHPQSWWCQENRKPGPPAQLPNNNRTSKL